MRPREAYADPLTGIPNRRGCERRFEQYRARPPGRDVALFMFDMNNLKTVNERMGHQGDDEEKAEDYLTAVNEKVVANNLLHIAEIERVSFAAAYVISNLRDEDITGLMDAADKAMYKRKSLMREGRD